MNADQITGEKVHILMRRRGIQQQALAEVLDLTQTSVSRKILGKRSWTVDELLATAQFLDVPITELLPGDEYAPVLTGRGRDVRPKGLEPLTFWFVVFGMPNMACDIDAEYAALCAADVNDPVEYNRRVHLGLAAQPNRSE
jgi:transcriptional regulator with XRE-family HTH domain